MNSLVVCRCGHTIVEHENGRCGIAGCTCRESHHDVLHHAIEVVRSTRK